MFVHFVGHSEVGPVNLVHDFGISLDKALKKGIVVLALSYVSLKERTTVQSSYFHRYKCSNVLSINQSI